MFKIEKNYTKEQIMEFYVNSYYLGSGSYGVEQASLAYFGKSAKEINLAEASMIAGLFQAPGRYDPYKNPKTTEERRKTVLEQKKLRHLLLKQENVIVHSYELGDRFNTYEEAYRQIIDDIRDRGVV